LRRRLDSVQQETKEALRESFHSTAESAGPDYQDVGAHRASRKNRRLGTGWQNGGVQEERESGQGLNWGTGKSPMPLVASEAAALSPVKFVTKGEVV